MATQGTKRSTKKKSQVIISNVATVALDVNPSYIINFAPFYAKLYSMASSITSMASNAFNAMRGKKRNAEEALPITAQAPAQNLTIFLTEPKEEDIQKALKKVRRSLIKEFEQNEASLNAREGRSGDFREFHLVEEAVAQYRPENTEIELAAVAPDVATAPAKKGGQPESTPRRVSFIPNALDSANGQRLQEAHDILKGANAKAPKRADGEKPLARFHARKAKMK